MIQRNRHTYSSIVALLGLLLLLLLLTIGCATGDVITYSRDAQRKGIALYNEGSYPEAAGAFRNASRQNPRDYRNYYYLGACYEQMGQFQQAIHSYRTARDTLNISLAAKQDHEFRMRIINGLGRSIARSDQRDLETDAISRETETRGGAENWFILAKIHAFRGDADSAIDAFNQASLLDPQNYLFLKDYGLYLEQIGQTQRAIAPLRRAYALNNQDQEVSQALRRMGIVPGPSLKPESALVQPTLPKGPIPELELNLDFLKRDASAGSRSTSPTVQAPRD